MWLRMTFNCTGKQPEAGNIETENTMFKETFTALAIVAGLVAITAPCAVVSPGSAVIIGAIGGVLIGIRGNKKSICC